MKKEKLLKTLLVLVISIATIAITTSVYALTDEDLTLDINEDDLTGSIEDTNTSNTDTSTSTGTSTNTNTSTSTEENKKEEKNTSTNTSTEKNTNTSTNNYNTNLPKAGLEDNTLLVAGITILAVIAICAYRKFKYYRNV